MKYIKDTNNKYMISSDGIVYRVAKDMSLKEVAGSICQGYRDVSLSISKGKVIRKRVHRIVAETFLVNEESKQQVDHIDGNKLNNNVKNLRWCTNIENQEFRCRQDNDGAKYSSKPLVNIIYDGIECKSIASLSRHLSYIRGSKAIHLEKRIRTAIAQGYMIYGKAVKVKTP